jgi:ATP-binding cassette subfamily B protein
VTQPFTNLRYTFQLLASLRRVDWLILLTLSVLLAAAPIATLLIVRYLVDHIAKMASDGSFTPWIASIWVPVIIYFVVNLIADSVETLQLLRISTLRDQVAFEIESRTIRKTLSHHDLGVYDRTDVKELLTLATGATADGQYLIQLISNLATGLLLVLPTLVIAGSLGLWIPLLVIATISPATLMQLRYEGKAWDIEQENVGLNNRISELRSAMVNPRFGADMRVYRMHTKMLPRWTIDARWLIARRRAIKSRGGYLVLLLAILSGLGLVVPYGYVIQQAIAGGISVGTLALFIGLIPELRRSLFIVFGNSTEVVGASKQLDGLRKYEATRPLIFIDPVAVDDSHDTQSASTAPAVRYIDVSFRYPGLATAPVVNHVDLDMPAGSVTLVVGENGSGKTTIAKLLCRLYDPTEGGITADGANLRETAILAHRRRTAALVQDPARLPMSLRDCLTFDIPEVPEPMILEALECVGLLKKVEHWSRGLETELSTSLSGGVDLSGGQWQRLAIARLFLQLPFKSLAVIDEPTNGLDPVADRLMNREILKRCAGKTTMIVSHRLQIAPLVTQVALMSNGRVEHVAPHELLSETSPKYNEMYRTSVEAEPS